MSVRGNIWIPEAGDVVKVRHDLEGSCNSISLKPGVIYEIVEVVPSLEVCRRSGGCNLACMHSFMTWECTEDNPTVREKENGKMVVDAKGQPRMFSCAWFTPIDTTAQQ